MEIVHVIAWKWPRRTLKRKTKFSLIAVQNISLRTNYVLTKIDNTQKITSYGYVMTEMEH